MKLMALGSNLGNPVENIRRAAWELAACGFEITARAPLYVTAPIPKSDQPDFVNTVLQVEFPGTPKEALRHALEIESQMGRVRNHKNEARVIDIDLIVWDDAVQNGPPELPHPRMQDRAFVLWPLCEIAPEWVHPVSKKIAMVLKRALPDSGIRLAGEQW